MPTNQPRAPISTICDRWWGWQEVPSPNPGWGASPAFVTEIVPLETGTRAGVLSNLQTGVCMAGRTRAQRRRSHLLSNKIGVLRPI